MKNGQSEVKIKNAENMPETFLEIHYSSSIQETALKKITNIKNMTSFFKSGKIGHVAKAIAYAKWSVWCQN